MNHDPAIWPGFFILTRNLTPVIIAAMPNRTPDITIRVLDWPEFGKETSLSLDRRLLADGNAVRSYCEQRFGKGSLSQGVDHTFEYKRQQFAAPSLMTLFTRLLNKSY